ncbi:uncharacterized protein K460DRAFT_401182 [Cucurbitaria berberidis CBS 394.84]|uniref:Uncharacterized protein n=1 Tax=Cucurbitaria berberidis CBS 394.84 TaxID=1168544 RepID=A0A9P4GTN5_9PLEO|nr:uncharacterized protein K460DRAFT_401182 [Cucurbitaria berberidis CBS 394.84]KAF1851155.1 hypothetical protein K460DRAFT_401182 [Cucurbitaria berberidis CBS 394.84]
MEKEHLSVAEDVPKHQHERTVRTIEAIQRSKMRLLVGIVFSCILAIIAGGPAWRIVVCDAASIVIFAFPIGPLCHYVERMKNDNDKVNSDSEAADDAHEVAQPGVPSPQYVARLFLLRQIEQHQRTGPHPRMEVDPSSGSVTIVAGE